LVLQQETSSEEYGADDVKERCIGKDYIYRSIGQYIRKFQPMDDEEYVS